MYRLLIVDDEAGHRTGLLGLLCLLKPDYLVFEAENAQRALQMMDVMALDLVITDIRMPGMDGLAFLSLARRKQPHARFTILSAYGTFEYAKKALRSARTTICSSPWTSKSCASVWTGWKGGCVKRGR